MSLADLIEHPNHKRLFRFGKHIYKMLLPVLPVNRSHKHVLVLLHSRQCIITNPLQFIAGDLVSGARANHPRAYPSASTSTPFSSNILASSPFWCIDAKMSQPPTNSFSTYSWGIVGHSEYSLIPAEGSPSAPVQDRTASYHFFISYEPCRNSSSSSTLNAVNFFGSTPCIPKICMLALENPHCGISGVPFMNRTTGAEATALSIAAFVSEDSCLVC